MAHQRVRKFNTKDTYPEQRLDNDLCQVVVAKGTMVFVRGQISQSLRDFEEYWNRRRGSSGQPGHEEHQDAARGGGLVAPAHLQDHDIHHRPALSGGCVSS